MIRIFLCHSYIDRRACIMKYTLILVIHDMISYTVQIPIYAGLVVLSQRRSGRPTLSWIVFLAVSKFNPGQT